MPANHRLGNTVLNGIFFTKSEIFQFKIKATKLSLCPAASSDFTCPNTNKTPGIKYCYDYRYRCRDHAGTLTSNLTGALVSSGNRSTWAIRWPPARPYTLRSFSTSKPNRVFLLFPPPPYYRSFLES